MGAPWPLLDHRDGVLERSRQDLGLGDAKLAMRLHVRPQLRGTFDLSAGVSGFAHFELNHVGNGVARGTTNGRRRGRRVGCAALDPFEQNAVIRVARALLLGKRREP